MAAGSNEPAVSFKPLKKFVIPGYAALSAKRTSTLAPSVF